jgi:hypothetical protein
VNFNHIDHSIQYGRVKVAKEKFWQLTTELGLRETNYHVGSGLGGNNFQLVTLMNLQHELSSDDITIEVKSDRIVWGAKWLAKAARKTVRFELDAKFPTILEKHKYLTLALQILADNPDSLREGFAKHKEHFPKLMRALNDKSFVFDPSMSGLEKLVMAYIVCQDLAVELDRGAGTFTKVSAAAAVLIQFPPEIILLSVRRYIQIERLVRHNLDEHPDFLKVLNNVTRIVH